MQKLKEVVVIDAVRSAIGKSGRDGMKKNGQLCQASAQDLLAAVLRGLLNRVKKKSAKFDENEIEDVVIGCLSQIGEQGANIARTASLLAGIPIYASGCTVNQFCNASQQAINMSARAIKAGDGDIYVCGGVELMSHYFMGSCMKSAMDAGYPVRFTSRMGETALSVPQGICAEMIAKDNNLNRDDLDRFGLRSMQRSVNAEAKGWHADHIIPFDYTYDGKSYHVEKDEVLRSKAVEDPEGYLQDLAKLRPSFDENGIVTAGNSSQIVDAASAVLLMSADKAEKLGLEPLCRITGMASAGDKPVPMLLAPIPATKKALERAGKKIEDMDIIEPNEAFASVVMAFLKENKVAFDDPRINPTGGAIAMGHPIGASGALYFGEMAHHLKRTKAKAGVQTMCGGGGIGIATVIERV